MANPLASVFDHLARGARASLRWYTVGTVAMVVAAVLVWVAVWTAVPALLVAALAWQHAYRLLLDSASDAARDVKASLR